MQFKQADEVSSICWQLREADYDRGLNRARINNLFNGWPPYSPQEVEENGVEINVNYLESTVIGHDARSQFYQAFLKPGNFFKLTTDMGPVHNRQKYSNIVTKEINKRMKRDLPYFETMRSKFANCVLHSPGPAVWADRDCPLPDAIGVEDLLVPANTHLTFKNLPFFCLLKSFTAPELIKLTRGKKRDPAWNVELVDDTLRWIDRETMALLGTNYAEIWSPEKLEERVKGDGGFYMGDQVPTVDVFDFYYWSDEGGNEGWRRRMLIDDWSNPTYFGTPYGQGPREKSSRNEKLKFARNKWLYDPGSRKYADSREEIFSCQFADLSAVGPFRYHTARSLGFLMYAVCHLQNRMRCKFNESVMEALMMYFRVKSQEDVQRVLKTNLINRGFIDETLQFVPAADRFQVNAGLVQLGLSENSQIIQRNSSSYTQNTQQQRDRVEKTATQIQAEVASMSTLVSAALTQAYAYQNFEYIEIKRRFMRNSKTNAMVKDFRAACLRQGVPEKYLTPECWECEPDRVLSPSKSMEMAIANWLMEHRDKFDPEPQREILRSAALAVTDDSAKADALVPEQPNISDSITSAQYAFGALMAGGPVSVKSGLNELDYIPALMASMAHVLQTVQVVGLPTTQELVGLNNTASHINEHIQILAQDKNNKAIVKGFSDQLGKMMNLVKALTQRFQEHNQSQNGNGKLDPETAAKVQSTMLLAQAKAQNTKTSHAQRTAQRQVQFELEQKRKDQQTAAEIARDNAKTAAEIHRNRFKSLTDE
jgi:hypothetical protein